MFLKIFLSLFSCMITSSAFGVIMQNSAKPWVRFESGLEQIKLSPDSKRLAYVEKGSGKLFLVELSTGVSHEISSFEVGSSFQFAPDSCRLFFREIIKKNTVETELKSKLKAFDCYAQKTIEIDEYNAPTGYLSLDPKKSELILMKDDGRIIRKQVQYPENRVAKWIAESNSDKGVWIPTPSKIIWLKSGSKHLVQLEDDGSGIESFDISPDSSAITWTTLNGRVYISSNGHKSINIGLGRDAKWHPIKREIVYVCPRSFAGKTIDFDLRIADFSGAKDYLSRTPEKSERWPQWDLKNNRLIFTAEKSTDLFSWSFEPHKMKL